LEALAIELGTKLADELGERLGRRKLGLELETVLEMDFGAPLEIIIGTKQEANHTMQNSMAQIKTRFFNSFFFFFLSTRI
jgi:hypothetical protein